MSSGNNYDGTLTNGAVIDTNGGTNQIGDGKLSLDGNNDYVDFSAHAANFDNLTEGTIAVWVYHDVNSRDVIFEMSDSGDADSRLALFRDSDGSFDFYVREGTTTLVDVSHRCRRDSAKHLDSRRGHGRWQRQQTLRQRRATNAD